MGEHRLLSLQLLGLALAPVPAGAGKGQEQQAMTAGPPQAADRAGAKTGPEPKEGEGRKPAADRTELGILPAVAGNSDIGIGFGAVGSLTRFAQGADPYHWKVTALLFLTVKEAKDGSVELPYHDDYLELDMPGLLESRLRLGLRLAFGRYTNSGYYGMGNAARAFDERGPRYHQYDHILTGLQARARIEVLPHLQLWLGGHVYHDWIEIYPQSMLEEDLAAADEHTRELLQGVTDHATIQLDIGWLWDSRDHELVPTRGMLHEISWRAAPGTTIGAPTVYGGLNLTARFFHSLHRDLLVLATRLMADLLVGRPPFFELAKHGGFNPAAAIGGGWTLRGVPLERYHGKIKLLGNLELRAKLLPFSLFKQRFNLGAIVFVDAGRVWADYEALPELDGEGLGLKAGVGGGLRLQWGEAFLIRGDVAWSPDADPVGIYVDVFHIF